MMRWRKDTQRLGAGTALCEKQAVRSTRQSDKNTKEIVCLVSAVALV